jgi:C1A family cysteine protease
MVDQQKQGQPVEVPARAFIYYNARAYEGTTDQDSGAQVRDAVKGIVNYGVPPDSEFPYNDQVFNQKPDQQVYNDAIKQKALVYEAVSYPHLDAALASGFPVVFGFTVYESFESQEVASNGIVPIPQPDEPQVGGHCVWMWGYNSSYKQEWATPTGKRLPPRSKACRNSWDVNWGDGGDFYLPQWYFDNGQCSDFWVIRRIA